MNKSVTKYEHPRFKRSTVTEIAISKSNRTKMSADTVKATCDKLQNQLPNSKIMIRVLTNQRWITIKGYTQDSNVILGEADYLGGRDYSDIPSIYRAHFYVVTRNKKNK